MSKECFHFQPSGDKAHVPVRGVWACWASSGRQANRLIKAGFRLPFPGRGRQCECPDWDGLGFKSQLPVDRSNV